MNSLRVGSLVVMWADMMEFEGPSFWAAVKVAEVEEMVEATFYPYLHSLRLGQSQLLPSGSPKQTYFCHYLPP